MLKLKNYFVFILSLLKSFLFWQKIADITCRGELYTLQYILTNYKRMTGVNDKRLVSFQKGDVWGGGGGGPGLETRVNTGVFQVAHHQHHPPSP